MVRHGHRLPREDAGSPRTSKIEVVERLREQGPGWQTRVNETLRKVVGL
jgi:uncharacterized protein (DUF4415 family)